MKNHWIIFLLLFSSESGSTSNMNTDSEENNKRKIILRVNEEPLEYFQDMPPRKLKKLSYLKINSSLMRKVEEPSEDVVRPLKEDAKKKETPVENDNEELVKKRKRIVSKGRNKSMESTAEVEKPDSGRTIRGKKKKGLSENPEKEETPSEKNDREPEPLKEMPRKINKKVLKKKKSTAVEETKTDASEKQMKDEETKVKGKVSKNKAKSKQEEVVPESEKAPETEEKPIRISKKVVKKKIVRKQINVEQKEDPVPKMKKGLKRNVKTEADLLDGAIASRRKARSCTTDKIPEKKKSTDRSSEKGSVERVTKRKNSNAEKVDEPVKEVQKPIPVNINKKTKVAEKLKKKSLRA